MTKNAFILVFFRFYNILWQLALPFLRKNKRLSQGFHNRIDAFHHTRADIWIQAASAGEAYLAVTLIRNLNPGKSIKVLATSITAQGIDILHSGLKKKFLHERIDLKIDWFPFDMPRTIKGVVNTINPSVMVLLETEIWPALLYCLKQNQTKIFIVNARLSKKSHTLYLKTKFLWKHLAPDRILATSDQDARRYRDIFEQTRVDTMLNIKFESIKKDTAQPDTLDRLKQILPETLPLSILASVRKQEEDQSVCMAKKILDTFPAQVLAIFPRHLHRVAAWKKRLRSSGLDFHLRSRITSPVNTPGIILWDTFGELKTVYGSAAAVFVGGSLKSLGGQNFIEPAIEGAVTITGPHYDDFAWATDDIFTKGIVLQKPDWESAARAMCNALEKPGRRSDRKQRAESFIHARRGGTRQACHEILKAFDESF